SLDFNNFKEWLIWQDGIEKQLGKNIRLKMVRKAILSMLNTGNDNYSNLHINWLNNYKGEVSLEKFGVSLSEKQMSSGEKTLLTITADLARRLSIANPTLSNPLQGKGVVMIDELDLHLHPKWQRVIVDKLTKTFPNLQFIVTTHSPYIIASVNPEATICLDPENEVQLTAKDKKRNTKGLEPNRVLKELMDTELYPDDTLEKMLKIKELLNPDFFDSEELQNQLAELTDELGIKDPFIMRAEHQLLMFKRRAAKR
ncbi:AAA family ATPase, partial [Candidatus Marithioploca araucensis]|nr:AAA family ATPase [Candidatus Marithioploca araucensis]